jgi:hypothetical protein
MSILDADGDKICFHLPDFGDAGVQGARSAWERCHDPT